MTSISMPRMESIAEERGATSRGLLRRLFARLVEARSRSAERIAATHMAALPDTQLAKLGFSEVDIALLRAGEPAAGFFSRW
jgi:hypothetical protein